MNPSSGLSFMNAMVGRGRNLQTFSWTKRRELGFVNRVRLGARTKAGCRLERSGGRVS